MNSIKWNITFFSLLLVFVLTLIPLFSTAWSDGNFDFWEDSNFDYWFDDNFDYWTDGNFDYFVDGNFDYFEDGNFDYFEDGNFEDNFDDSWGDSIFEDNFQPFDDIPGNTPGPDFIVPPGPDIPEDEPQDEPEEPEEPDEPEEPEIYIPSRRIDKPSRDISIYVSKIRIPNAYGSVSGDDYVPVYVSMQNAGSEDLDDTKVIFQIPELGLRDSKGPFDFNDGEKKSLRFMVQMPANAEPGTYTARLFVHNGDKQRIIHREVEVIDATSE